MMSGDSVPVKRVKHSKSDLSAYQKEEIVEKYIKLQNHMEHLVVKHQRTNEELLELRQNCSKLKAQFHESSQREGMLVMRLTLKEQEIQELLAQIQEAKQSQNRGSTQLRSMILDPAVNLMYRQMQKEIDGYKLKLEQAQGDAAALKFTPESQTGKRLVAKCHSLMLENEEIGRMLSSGSIAKLEGELAMEKQLVRISRKTEESCEKYLYEMDTEVEEMQAALLEYQHNLILCQEKVKLLTEENNELKSSIKARAAANDKSGKKESIENDIRHDSTHKDSHGRHANVSSASDSKKKNVEKVGSSSSKSTSSKPSLPVQDSSHQQCNQAAANSHPKSDLPAATLSNEKSKKSQDFPAGRHASSSGSADKKTKKHSDDRYDNNDKSSNARTSDGKNKSNLTKNENSDVYKSKKRNYDAANSDEKSDERRLKRRHFSGEDHDRTKANVLDVSNGPKNCSSAQSLLKK